MIRPGRPALALLVFSGHAAEAADEVRAIPTRPGVTQSFIVVRPAARPVAAGGPDGLVLTSTVTRRGRERPETVGDVRLQDIRVPTLVVNHRDDACRGTPYADTPALMGDLAGAPPRELLTFTGGEPPRSGPCEARAAHGYVGLDAAVVTAISEWITADGRP